jgi:DNA-binding beta-propeller fold protein YncE
MKMSRTRNLARTGLALALAIHALVGALPARSDESIAGSISTVAGVGRAGCWGDRGPALSAALDGPQDLALDAGGNLFIADSVNQRSRRVGTDGLITTVAGSGPVGPKTLKDGLNWPSGDGGPAIAADLWYPSTVAVDAAGNLFIAETVPPYRIRRVGLDGIISTVYALKWIYGLGVDGADNIYASSAAYAIASRISPTGGMSTLAGWFDHPGFAGDDNPARMSLLNSPMGVALDDAGHLYVADQLNHRVRKVSGYRAITTVAGSGPVGLMAGGFAGDNGPATQALLNQPVSVAVDRAGNLFVADFGNDRVRKVGLDGTITTVAGGGTQDPGDGGPATVARLRGPWGLAIDREGNLFIAESSAHRVRKVSGIAAPGLLAGGPFP